MGRLTSLYGLKGWVKLHSYTDPIPAILDYDPLYITNGEDWQVLAIDAAREHGKGLVVKIADVNDRDQASALLGRDLAIQRSQLPPLNNDEVYWVDLQGLQVVNTQGVEFGHIERLFATGANDVMVIQGERERLVPFLRPDVVQEIDFSTRRMRVDWDADF